MAGLPHFQPLVPPTSFTRVLAFHKPIQLISPTENTEDKEIVFRHISSLNWLTMRLEKCYWYKGKNSNLQPVAAETAEGSPP